MAHPYTTIERVKRLCAGKGERLTSLLDRNLDGIADDDGVVSVFNDAINRAANKIDGRLSTRYQVPFATTTPSSPHYAPTLPQVADLADLYALGLLLSRLDPTDPEARALFDEFDDSTREYRSGQASVVGATEIATSAAPQGFAWEGKGTTVAGMTDENGDPDAAYTDDSVDQTTGM